MSVGIFTRISLKNGEKVSVTKFKASYTLWIPENIEFALDSKYNDVEISDFTGNFNFDLYDTDIRAGDFGDNSTFNAKYSSFSIGNGKNVSFDIYDCDVTGKDLDDVKIITKYSSLTFSSVKSVTIQSYDDDFDIQLTVNKLPHTFSSFTGNFKYGTVTLNADSLLNYRLSCQKTYGSLNYPKERFTNKPSLYIEKDSKTQFENSTAPDANCEISFTAYDLNFTIK